ncbi:hypothetical protein ACET98_23690 [Aeromonas veronii]
MLNDSNTLESHDIVSHIAAYLSHEKKSSDDITGLMSMMKKRADCHTELLSGLISMSQHGFQLDSFSHVLDELYAQSEEITSYLSLLSIPSDSDSSH